MRRSREPSGADVRRAERLLERLLVAFGLERAPRRWAGLDEGAAKHERKVKLALSGLPADWKARTAIYRREVVEAEPLVTELLSEVDGLRSEALPTPEDYQRRWQAIIDRWDDAIYDNGWLALAPLCKSCGVPVFARQPQRHGNGNVDLSMVCGDRCRATIKMREHRSK